MKSIIEAVASWFSKKSPIVVEEYSSKWNFPAEEDETKEKPEEADEEPILHVIHEEEEEDVKEKEENIIIGVSSWAYQFFCSLHLVVCNLILRD